MNDEELSQLLKSASLPPRPAGYWGGFPEKVKEGLRQRPALDAAPRRSFVGLGIIGLAAACLTIGLFVQLRQRAKAGGLNADLAKARKYYSEVEAMFPNQIQAIVFDSNGAHLLLGAKADMPQKDPLFLKVCGSKGCENVVTFSGQEIALDGDKCEVLAQTDGQIILVGEHLVWPGGAGSKDLSVTAQLLGESPSL